MVEGDLIVEREGLVLASEMVPAFQDTPLGALFITGSLRAPNATIAEPRRRLVTAAQDQRQCRRISSLASAIVRQLRVRVPI